MAERGLLQGVADEGGFWPAFDSNEEALDALVRAIERAGFTPGRGRRDLARRRRLASSTATAATGWRSTSRALDTDGMAEMLLGWLDRYPIVSIEDPLAEDDPEGLRALHRGGRRPRADHRRRFPRHQRGAGARGGRRAAPATPC